MTNKEIVNKLIKQYEQYLVKLVKRKEYKGSYGDDLLNFGTFSCVVCTEIRKRMNREKKYDDTPEHKDVCQRCVWNNEKIWEKFPKANDYYIGYFCMTDSYDAIDDLLHDEISAEKDLVMSAQVKNRIETLKEVIKISEADAKQS